MAISYGLSHPKYLLPVVTYYYMNIIGKHSSAKLLFCYRNSQFCSINV